MRPWLAAYGPIPFSSGPDTTVLPNEGKSHRFVAAYEDDWCGWAGRVTNLQVVNIIWRRARVIISLALC